jgi:hypothetical protein
VHKVQAKTIDEYFNADPVRKSDLEALDMLIRDTAPKLDRWFYAGASDGKPGMRISLIGHGSFQYEIKSSERVEWPIVGVALQKNYMTLYTSVFKDDAPIVDQYIGRLGELKAGINNFSFVTFDQLDRDAVAARQGHRGYDPAGPDRIVAIQHLPHRVIVGWALHRITCRCSSGRSRIVVPAC